MRRFSGRAWRQRRIGFVLFGLARGNGLFEIFQSQVELVGIELFRTPAELHPLQLANQVAQSVVLTSELIASSISRAFSDRSASRSACAASTSARSAAMSSGRISGLTTGLSHAPIPYISATYR